MQKPVRTTAKSVLARFTPRQFKLVTQQMYQRNLELAQLNKTLSLLRTVDQIVLGDHQTLESIATKLSAAIVSQYNDCSLAAVYSSAGTQSKRPQLLGYAGAPVGEGQAYDDAAVREFFGSQTASAALLTQASGFLNVHKHQAQIGKVLGVDTAAIKKLVAGTHLEDFYVGQLVGASGVMGVLLIGLHKPGDENTATLLARVTEAVSKAVENKILQDENQRILQKLRQTNAKLKALDETKDEFITMASHQLRTPLTSVKGYLSMVLEGDAGKLNANQRKLLQQSFISSQRMVYLISDLLNLSRLSTGKFVIESSPVDLREVVQGEIDQLDETAKSRGLALAYKAPKTFPVLMLDETKIHQVVMNLIDNAIYYTPSGGAVTVALHETSSAVEYTVTDTGIGVPKSVQHRLFSKFYRAGNAQQARPDGTGLGLFMAKKVIVAQGGAIIFSSQEGRGSTFGFRFNKARHLAPKTGAR